MYLFGFLLFGLMCNMAQSTRVVGWKMDVFTIGDNSRYLGTKIEFGDSASSGTWITWGSWNCLGFGHNGYCYLRLKISKINGIKHFQITGTDSDVFDNESRYICGTSGIARGDRSGRKVSLADGFAWNGCRHEHGYRYLSAYGKWTTDQPLISAFSYQQVKYLPERRIDKREQIMGTKLNTDVVVNTGEFHCWSHDWGSDTMVILRYYEPPTELIKFEAHFDRKKIRGVTDVIAKYRIIENDGCGLKYVEGMTGTQTDKVEIAITTTVGWSRSFSFNFEISSTVSGGIGAVSASLTMKAGFSYSQSSNFEETQRKTETNEYKWPTYCPPGYKCRTEILRKTEDTVLPTTFTFKRGTVEFTEANVMETKMQSTHEKIRHDKITRTSNCRRRRR